MRVVAATLILALLASGAAGQTKKQMPAVQTPATFRGAGPNVDQTSIGDLKWFEVFRDPALQDLVKTAMVQNYDVRAAVARIDAARANLGLARSEQFPQFDLSTDVTSTRASRNGQLAIPNQGGRSRSFGSVLLNLLTFELDVWGRVRQQTKAARADLRASEEDRKAVLTTVVGDVATGYFSLL
ncbi:MAG TPA: TolC family protein, partial [Pyrinomonadaceae bacterium]|nr:TolC family protein [Pyrinomonadaceae bacterium]